MTMPNMKSSLVLSFIEVTGLGVNKDGVCGRLLSSIEDQSVIFPS